MKQCPSCRTTYTDDTLTYCLSDGTRLVDVADEEPTVVRDRKGDSGGVDASLASGSHGQRTSEHLPSRSSHWIKIAAAVIVAGIAVLAILGVGGAILYYQLGPGPQRPTPTPTIPTPPATATPDREKERLRDEIANIRKRLDEANKNSGNGTSETDDERGSPITATVNSPNDGFLALRSQPDSEHGERIAKIPDGAEIEILRCSASSVTIAGRSGRWCYVSYGGQTGWVFDAWLDY